VVLGKEQGNKPAAEKMGSPKYSTAKSVGSSIASSAFTPSMFHSYRKNLIIFLGLIQLSEIIGDSLKSSPNPPNAIECITNRMGQKKLN
jgi:hypothetical protein